MEKDNNIQFMEFRSFLPEAIKVPDIVDRKSSRGYVLWGEDNKMPQYLWSTYLKCSDLQALVNTTVDYMAGGQNEVTKPDNLLTDDDSFQDVIQKAVFDYILFGGFALEGIRNAKGDIVRVNYINVMNVRTDEDLEMAYISNSWDEWSAKKIIKLPLFDKNELQPHFIFYYRGAITRNINPIPIWFAGLKSAQVLNETRTYNLRNIQNNFSANVMVTLNGAILKQNELQDIKDKLEMGYSGSENAGKTLVINNANENGSVEVTRLDSDKSADLYKNVQDSSIEDLYGSFRMNKVLCGKNIQTGFSKVEFENIYALYNATVIEPLRNNVTKEFAKLGVNIHFENIQINWSE